MIAIHNTRLREYIRPNYTRKDLEGLEKILIDAGTFTFSPMKTGLYPAAALTPELARQTGYGNVWVRDNIHVANALAIGGREADADRVALALAKFYSDHAAKFYEIIEGRRSHHVPMHRPHIRFNGAELVESEEIWPHAQNDALGLFLWFYCRRALLGAFPADFALLEMFALYFERISYWRDADSGHWEERAKVEASSIGCIVAALRLVQSVRDAQAAAPWARGFSDAKLEGLLYRGETALADILPWECRGPGPLLARRYDSALLFLVWPLDVVAPDMARRICEDVAAHLQGEHGIRRYLGDSYWTADYKAKLEGHRLTSDFSLSQSERDKLAKPGEEAQWSLFDPVLSVIAGQRYLKTRAEADRDEQVLRFHRALGQITPDWKCPEAYYLENGRYVPNDHVPLLWTQANLMAAFSSMKATASAA
jgi:phosphorylase kinase alpha/beta subunit